MDGERLGIYFAVPAPLFLTRPTDRERARQTGRFDGALTTTWVQLPRSAEWPTPVAAQEKAELSQIESSLSSIQSDISSMESDLGRMARGTCTNPNIC